VGQLSIPDYQQAVHNLYAHATQLSLAAQAALFQIPLMQMLEQPPAVLQNWIECSDCYMTQQIKAEKDCTCLNTPDICSFLGGNSQLVDDLHPL